jgi:hypothetical protein
MTRWCCGGWCPEQDAIAGPFCEGDVLRKHPSESTNALDRHPHFGTNFGKTEIIDRF